LSVLRLLGRLFLVIALTLAVGLHWVVLQSVAWTAMLVKYTKQQSLCVAVDLPVSIDNTALQAARLSVSRRNRGAVLAFEVRAQDW
jgi:hypothetical protein